MTTQAAFLASLLLASSLASPAILAAEPEKPKRPNVLFIAVDDLRPQLGCYGEKQMVSPNIDRLAAGGVMFDRSYCMVPTCGASRASLMTSVRPSRNRFVTHLAWADREAPGVTTLNTHFKNNGYYTVSNGKVFHHPEDSAEGWSEPAWRPKGVPAYHLPENRAAQGKRGKAAEGVKQRGPAYESADVPDDAYADGQLALKTIEDLRRLKAKDQPFFLAVGFFKPHLPFVAPKKYWDLYRREDVKLPATYHRPTDAPDIAIHNSGELRAYAGIPKQGVLDEDLARTLIHGYYACVSHTDAQVGRVLDELKRLGLEENTIVVLWGDHGWNLGEHTLWNKHSCFETSMRTPLIVRAPGVAGGKTTAGLTEFIDVYPSLCDLAKLPTPAHVQGRSFVPLLKDPGLAWKASAVGRFGPGDTIRTDRFRFTEYTSPAGDRLARMLYDHEADPAEDVNVAKRPDNRERVDELTDLLHREMGRDTAANRAARKDGRPAPSEEE